MFAKVFTIFIAVILQISRDVASDFACKIKTVNATMFSPIEASDIISGERLQYFADVIVSTPSIAEFHSSFACKRCSVIFFSEAEEDDDITATIKKEDFEVIRSARLIFIYTAILPKVLQLPQHGRLYFENETHYGFPN